MALAATIVRCRASLDNFPEHVVQRPDKFGRSGVVAFFELLDFNVMASRTIIRRNNHCDLVAVMVKRRRIARSRLVAGIAVHTFCAWALLFHCSTMPGVDEAWHSMQA
jgi:predicted SnoaL-like aldol condensation-catalyzing enzyme